MKNVGLLLLVVILAFSSCKKKDKVNSSYLGTYVGQYDVNSPEGEADCSECKVMIKKGSNAKELRTASGMVFLLDEDHSGSFSLKPNVITNMIADTLDNYMKTVSGSGKFDGKKLTFQAKLVNEEVDTFYNHITFEGKK